VQTGKGRLHTRAGGCGRRARGNFAQPKAKLLAAAGRERVSSLAAKPSSGGAIPNAKL